ncbi:MAG TPA: type II toxin-antitoxin system HicB family antitoxin [Herpetosiphonaceae bacterium]
MMEYKGYLAKIEFDQEASVFHGQVINIRDIITFQGQSVEELRREFAESVEDYLEFCAERGEEPEKPFSGKFLVRTDPTLHREIAIAASRENQSINTWVNEVLRQAIESRSAA